ncbi:hypothetical protein BD560DRAFT_362612, partial [Blakeslea trispora]
MVSPLNNHFGKTGGLDPPPTRQQQPSSTRSWSQVVGKHVRQSLIPNTIGNSSHETQNSDKIVKTSIWRPGHGNNSVYIDMSGRKETKTEFYKLLLEQYPSRIGARPQQLGNLKFAEISFQRDDNAMDAFLEKGLLLQDGVRILPCRALASDMSVVNIRLSNLPFLVEKELVEGLKESLSPYGTILDVGMLVDPETKTYECNGYAVLHVPNEDNKVNKLTHS